MTATRHDRPILVPVDFSPYSEAALLFAAEQAKCLGNPLLVLHVVHDPGDMPGYYSRAMKKKPLHRIEDGASAMLEKFLRRIVKNHPEFKKLSGVDSLLVTGLPTTRILEVAEKRDAAMIVLGSKGLTGIKHLLMGSVAERVVQLADIPVTVVKADI
jgi:nucleotide-binding universal stress UspA family protein